MGEAKTGTKAWMQARIDELQEKNRVLRERNVELETEMSKLRSQKDEDPAIQQLIKQIQKANERAEQYKASCQRKDEKIARLVKALEERSKNDLAIAEAEEPKTPISEPIFEQSAPKYQRKTAGRPATSQARTEKVQLLLNVGYPIREIAKQTGLSIGTVCNIKKKINEQVFEQ